MLSAGNFSRHVFLHLIECIIGIMQLCAEIFRQLPLLTTIQTEMVNKLIELSLRNRLIVLIIAMGLLGWGIYNVQRNPVDAIPDLSENQVIVFTEWMGQSPQIIEDQVTYLLVSNL